MEDFVRRLFSDGEFRREFLANDDVADGAERARVGPILLLGQALAFEHCAEDCLVFLRRLGISGPLCGDECVDLSIRCGDAAARALIRDKDAANRIVDCALMRIRG